MRVALQKNFTLQVKIKTANRSAFFETVSQQDLMKEKQRQVKLSDYLRTSCFLENKLYLHYLQEEEERKKTERY